MQNTILKAVRSYLRTTKNSEEFNLLSYFLLRKHTNLNKAEISALGIKPFQKKDLKKTVLKSLIEIEHNFFSSAVIS